MKSYRRVLIDQLRFIDYRRARQDEQCLPYKNEIFRPTCLTWILLNCVTCSLRCMTIYIKSMTNIRLPLVYMKVIVIYWWSSRNDPLSGHSLLLVCLLSLFLPCTRIVLLFFCQGYSMNKKSVSYTHLTLPTICSV